MMTRLVGGNCTPLGGGHHTSSSQRGDTELPSWTRLGLHELVHGVQHLKVALHRLLMAASFFL